MLCLICWKESWRSKYCISCREKKQNAGAIVSQNKKKLKKLLELNILTPYNFNKFILYSTNIITYWKIVLKYKSEDIKTTFQRILEYWTLFSWIMSLLFISEILIIEI